jgi:hypothetical protein
LQLVLHIGCKSYTKNSESASQTRMHTRWFIGDLLAVQGSPTADAARVQGVIYDNATNQQWTLDYLGNTYYRLLNRNNGADMLCFNHCSRSHPIVDCRIMAVCATHSESSEKTNG